MTTATDKPSKHLDSLTIKNFRMLEDVEIEKLGHVNLIVGKNNSGKSTVLEALALLASGLNKQGIFEIASCRNDLRVYQERTDTKIRVAFENFFTKNGYPLNSENSIYIGNEDFSTEINHIFYITEVDENKSKFVPRTKKVIVPKDVINEEKIDTSELMSGLKFNLCDGTQKIITIDEENNIILKSNYDLVLPFERIESSLINVSDLGVYWDSLLFTGYEETVVQSLQVIEPKIEDLAFIQDRYVDRFFEDMNNISPEEMRKPYVKLKGQKGGFPLFNMGDGIIKLLQILIKLPQARDGFLLIDEFENGLHYSVQPKVWGLIFELAKRFNIQVFATTHSWDCIESFAQISKEHKDLDGVLFRMGRSVRKSDKGKVIATVYDEEDLHYITKAKMEVR